jgi:ubiquinone/menaquinone biosynthesis C-methylase UbiE
MFSSRNYDRAATFYGALAHIYSGGLIRKSKRAQIAYLPQKSRVLYLGAGDGDDATAAAAAGHDVTAVDLSARMAERLRARLADKRVDAEVIVADVFLLDPVKTGRFDAICGNYFFNVFPESEVEAVINQAVRFIKPGGLLMVADMAPQSGFGGILGWLYLKFGLMFFVILRLASPHPIYDYASLGTRAGLAVEAIIDHRWASFLPALFRTIVLRNPE